MPAAAKPRSGSRARPRAKPRRLGGLPPDNDSLSGRYPALQERLWLAERIGWAIFGLLIVLALLGFTGAGGPFAHASLSLPSGTIDYPRVARWQASDQIRVSFAPGPSQRRVTLSPALLGKVDVDHVVPSPSATQSGPQGAVYVFDIDGARGGEVDFSLRVEHPGWTGFDIGLDGDSAPGAMLVLP
jgi:hypothetical protein